MILLTAVFAGTIIGWGYAGWKGRAWQPPAFQGVWLVLVGFLPQLLAFYLPHTRGLLPDGVASASLIASQVLLLVFTLANIRLPGMFLLTVGLACNLVAILLNDGFMPLRLESAAQLVNPRVLAQLTIGERISNSSKDILLPQAQILLPWLADRFVVPEFLPYRFVFSAGDVLVAVGAFWMLSCGRENTSSY